MNVAYATDTWHTNSLRRWQKPGDITDVPRIEINGRRASYLDRYLVDASYFAIKNITLGYTLPHLLTKKIGVDRFRIFGRAENLFTWTKYWGFDPEIGSGATSLGVDYGVYPQARTYTIGFNISL